MSAAAIADLSAFGVAASENSGSSRWVADPTRRRGGAGSFGKGKLGGSMQTIFDSKALPLRPNVAKLGRTPSAKSICRSIAPRNKKTTMKGLSANCDLAR
jgi:hypothetical protein